MQRFLSHLHLVIRLDGLIDEVQRSRSAFDYDLLYLYL